MGFSNSIIGGAAALIRAALRSPNFVTQVSGWQVSKDGSAEFNNITIRGTFAGTLFTLNSSGLFFYSPTEAAGNLIVSLAATAGSDSFGNTYPQGVGAFLGSPRAQVFIGPNGANLPGIFAEDPTSIADILPGMIWFKYGQAGTTLQLLSGRGTPAATGCDIILQDSLSGSGIANGIISLDAGIVNLGAAENAWWDDAAQQLNVPKIAGTVSGNPDTWHAMGAFGAGFSHGTPAPAYKYFPDGTVGFTGQVSVTAGTTSGTVFTLPTAAYFPLSVKTFPVPIGAGTPATSGSARVNIGTVGNIVLAGGPTVAAYTFSLDGIRYPLDI